MRTGTAPANDPRADSGRAPSIYFFSFDGGQASQPLPQPGFRRLAMARKTSQVAATATTTSAAIV